MIAILPSLRAVYAAGVFLFACARFRAVSTCCAVRTDLIVDAVIFCHVSIALAFIAATDGNKIAELACVSRDIYLPL